MSNKYYKKLVDSIIGLTMISVPISFANLIGSNNSPCGTYGYYLPVTFVMCNINKSRGN